MSAPAQQPESAPTPGPWRIDGDDVVARSASGEELPVANVLGDTPEQAHANARLIAAAPNLFAALRDIMRYADTIGSIRLIDAARAALAKVGERVQP